MKQISLTLALMLGYLLSPAYGQIPNGGFEDWEATPYYEKPLFWNTNQDSDFVRFEKDTICVEGNFSLKAIPSTYSAYFECNSQANIRVGLDMPVGEGKCLAFFLKSIPDSTNQCGGGICNTFFRIAGRFWASGISVSVYKWESYVPIDTFTEIEIPIADPDVDSLSIYIYAGAENGATDGCHFQSISWVDGIRIKTIAGYEPKPENDPADVTVFPNPSNGTIQIDPPNGRFDKYQIIDNLGRMIQEGRLMNSTILFESKGVFWLRLFQSDGKAITKKILIH